MIALLLTDWNNNELEVLNHFRPQMSSLVFFMTASHKQLFYKQYESWGHHDLERCLTTSCNNNPINNPWLQKEKIWMAVTLTFIFHVKYHSIFVKIAFFPVIYSILFRMYVYMYSWFPYGKEEGLPHTGQYNRPYESSSELGCDR